MHTKLIPGLLTGALAALAAFIGCGGGGSGSTALVQTVTVTANLGNAEVPGRTASHGSGFALWAYDTGGNVVEATGDSHDGGTTQDVALTLAQGRVYRLLILNTGHGHDPALHATVLFQAGDRYTATLPLTATPDSTTLPLGNLRVPHSLALSGGNPGAVLLSGSQNPLTRLKSGGQALHTMAAGGALDPALATALDTVFTTRVAPGRGLGTTMAPTASVAGQVTLTGVLKNSHARQASHGSSLEITAYDAQGRTYPATYVTSGDGKSRAFTLPLPPGLVFRLLVLHGTPDDAAGHRTATHGTTYVLHATVAYGAGNLSTATLPLTGTLAATTLDLGDIAVPHDPGATVHVVALTGANNPLSHITGSGGAAFDTCASPALQASLSTALDTAFATVAQTLHLDTARIPFTLTEGNCP